MSKRDTRNTKKARFTTRQNKMENMQNSRIKATMLNIKRSSKKEKMPENSLPKTARKNNTRTKENL